MHVRCCCSGSQCLLDILVKLFSKINCRWPVCCVKWQQNYLGKAWNDCEHQVISKWAFLAISVTDKMRSKTTKSTETIAGHLGCENDMLNKPIFFPSPEFSDVKQHQFQRILWRVGQIPRGNQPKIQNRRSSWSEYRCVIDRQFSHRLLCVRRCASARMPVCQRTFVNKCVVYRVPVGNP